MTEHTEQDLLAAAYSYKTQRDALQTRLDAARAEDARLRVEISHLASANMARGRELAQLQAELDAARVKLGVQLCAGTVIIPEWAVSRIKERIQQATDPTLPADRRYSAAFALVGAIEYWMNWPEDKQNEQGVAQ